MSMAAWLLGVSEPDSEAEIEGDEKTGCPLPMQEWDDVVVDARPRAGRIGGASLHLKEPNSPQPTLSTSPLLAL